MTICLLSAAAILVSTSGLVLGLIKLEKSEHERIKKLFEKETGDSRTFDELRAARYTGFTHRYLDEKFSVENLATTAVLEIVLDMVKLDLAEGAKPEEIVFGTCHYWPNIDVISLVIDKTGANIKNVLEYESKEGVNCLMIMFNIFAQHRVETRKDSVGTEMAREVEESVKYLIELGEKQGLKIKTILEKTTKTGETLLLRATFFSANLALGLLNRGIAAKSIDYKFMTPKFKFKSLHRPMIASGVNPFALNHQNRTQAVGYKVSKKLISDLNPGLTSDLFYSTTSLPCNDQTCDESCEQGLPNPWYYNNGLIYDFKKDDRIGGGAEGTVFSGEFHGREAAFKFIEIKNLKDIDTFAGIIDDLNKRLSEMKNLSDTNGENILPSYGHIRQQLSADKVKELGLGSEVTRYEVYITKQCDFNLVQLKNQIGINIDEAISIIDQLVDAQEQLQAAGVSHNDIKPGNILVDYDDEVDYKIYIGDFGQADQLGGTPGWTPPEFINPRVPGVSDMYSFGIVILYVLCEDKELFFALRDNFVIAREQQSDWYKDFLRRPEIKLITKMIKVEPNDRISSKDMRHEWLKIRGSSKFITKQDLNFPINYSTVQGCSTPTQLEEILGRNFTMTDQKTTFTRTHLQGENSLCWLYSVVSAIHQISVTDRRIKEEAMKFLSRKSFHQVLRNEILFGLIPKTLEPDGSQSNTLEHLIARLENFGLLSQEQGILELLTVRKFYEIIGHTPSFYFQKCTIDQCAYLGLFDYRIVTILGHDSSLNPPDFYHAVVMTACVDGVDKIKITLKNSYRGEHLKGIIDKNDINKTIQLKNITKVNSQIVWKLNYFWTFAVKFK